MRRVIPVRGRVVAVTGAAQGIGLETARVLAERGARVAIGDLDAIVADRAARSLGTGAVGLRLDVTSLDSFRTFLDEVAERLGPIDVLVNNAGVMWVGPFEDEPAAATRRQIEVNLLGVIHGTKLAAPAMRRRGSGHLVTIASAASKLAPPGEATYAATKHAVFGYLDAVRAELRGTGVRVSLVLPGVVETELAVGTSTGAVRRLQPVQVGRAVADVIERPRFQVVLPRRIGLLHTLSAVLPERPRELLLRLTVPDQVAAVRGRTARAEYETRSLG